MKKLLAIAILLLAGCTQLPVEEQLTKNVPTKVAEKNGVTLWKVFDQTGVTSQFVYFTTPVGETSWHQTEGESTTYRMVSGMTINGKKVYQVEDPR